MSKQADGGQQPLASIEELLAARTDFRDVEVEALGGKVLRLYGLSGTARAHLLAHYANVLPDDDTDVPDDPALLEKLLLFQVDVVAASLGYLPEQWPAVGAALGATAIEQLFDTASELSGIGPGAQAEAVQRLRPQRNAGSGTD